QRSVAAAGGQECTPQGTPLSRPVRHGTTNTAPAEDRPMPLTIGCTRCGKQLRLPETAAGQLCRCPSCFSTFTVVEQAGRFSVQPAATDDIPEVLPVVLPASPRSSEPKRDGEPAAVVPVPQTPEGAGPRPFVFRARILFDPEYRLAGEMQVRA